MNTRDGCQHSLPEGRRLIKFCAATYISIFILRCRHFLGYPFHFWFYLSTHLGTCKITGGFHRIASLCQKRDSKTSYVSIIKQIVLKRNLFQN